MRDQHRETPSALDAQRKSSCRWLLLVGVVMALVAMGCEEVMPMWVAEMPTSVYFEDPDASPEPTQSNVEFWATTAPELLREETDTPEPATLTPEPSSTPEPTDAPFPEPPSPTAEPQEKPEADEPTEEPTCDSADLCSLLPGEPVPTNLKSSEAYGRLSCYAEYRGEVQMTWGGKTTTSIDWQGGINIEQYADAAAAEKVLEGGITPRSHWSRAQDVGDKGYEQFTDKIIAFMLHYHRGPILVRVEAREGFEERMEVLGRALDQRIQACLEE